MKKTFFLVALIATAFLQSTNAQDSTAKQASTSPLLALYYNIKDALVAGNV